MIKQVTVPIGFRCFIKCQTDFALPFDCGFFPPQAIASVLNNPIINIDPDYHFVCKKYEKYKDQNLKGLGVKFETSTYDEIDRLSANKEDPNINTYLDSTFGYYTLNHNHGFVLAHYNWHIYADNQNLEHDFWIQNINETLNRRLKRMFDICNRVEQIFLYYDDAGYDYMMINEQIFDLSNIQPVVDAFTSMFKAKVVLINNSKGRYDKS